MIPYTLKQYIYYYLNNQFGIVCNMESITLLNLTKKVKSRSLQQRKEEKKTREVAIIIIVALTIQWFFYQQDMETCSQQTDYPFLLKILIM